MAPIRMRPLSLELIAGVDEGPPGRRRPIMEASTAQLTV